MSKHLNADQMAEWAAGVRRPELERHFGECAECRLALEELQTTFGTWRDAVRGWSDRQYQVAQQRMSARAMAGTMSGVPRRAHSNLYWATGMATCAFVAVLLWYAGPTPLTERGVTSSPIVDSSATESGRATNPDAVLMRQVDREVSQTVPDAMEPLMGLVSWDGSATADEDAAGGKPLSKQVE
jgi:hypothetical protein